MKVCALCFVILGFLPCSAANSAELTCKMTDYSGGAISSNNTAADTALDLVPEAIVPAVAVHRLDGSVAVLNDREMTGTFHETVSRIKISYPLRLPGQPLIDVSYSYSMTTGAIVASALIHKQIPRRIARIVGHCIYKE